MSQEPGFSALTVVLAADTQTVGEDLQKGIVSMSRYHLEMLTMNAVVSVLLLSAVVGSWWETRPKCMRELVCFKAAGKGEHHCGGWHREGSPLVNHSDGKSLSVASI